MKSDEIFMELEESLSALNRHVCDIENKNKDKIKHILKAFGRSGEVRAYLLLLFREVKK